MSAKEDSKYILSISLNVLNHLGLNLYSNNAAVLSEVIANAWDADATEVHINYSDKNDGTITIIDNGFGMDYGDVCEKYLVVGREKRENGDKLTPKKRKPMGRKGIGKLSTFSIAEKILVYTRKEGNDGEAFILDAAEIKQYIENDDSKGKPYNVPSLEFDGKIKNGTLIEITQFKRRLTQNTFKGLKQRIARRFSIIGEKHNFNVFLDGEKITYAERDYFDKARFLFQYKKDFSKFYKKLDKGNKGEKLNFSREYRFNDDGKADENGKYVVSGWIAIARHSNDLDDESKDDNLNKITLVVRGKVAQEDLLHEHRLGGMITKYMYGEIEADFLDTDNEVDIATSSRQKIIENDSRYLALKNFIGKELKYIWTETNKLKDKKIVVEHAIALVPSLREWYENLKYESLKEKARKIFGAIDSLGGDDGAFKQELFAYGVLAFEKQKMKHSLDLLEKMNHDNVQQLLTFFQDVDDIEAAHYHEIVQERLTVIKQLQEKTLEKVLECKLRDYLYDHLWLFDPAWDRITENAEMEKTMQLIVDGVQKKVRPDIKYRKPQREHVIIELKRPGIVLKKTEIEEQLKKYIKAVKDELKKQNDTLPVNGICIVGELPRGWDDIDQRRAEEGSLKLLNIRIMTYSELIKDAYAAYAKYLKGYTKGEKLRELIEKIKKGE